MEILVFWVILSVLVAAWARGMGRSFIWWLILALVLSPLLAGVLLLLCGPSRR